MKTEFLKNLGITEQSVIDQIMAENGRDVSKAKGDLTTLQTRVTDLENDIRTKDSTITRLQTEADKVDGLNQRISQLETDKTNLTNDLNTKVTQIQKTHAIEGRIRDAKGKNVKAIMALLDQEKITFENGELGGIDEQITALQGAEDSSMLFGEAKPASPSGTQPNNPPTGGNGGNPPSGKSFADAIAAKLNSKQ